MDDIYAAEKECCRLECLMYEAEANADRYRKDLIAAVVRLRGLVREAGERKAERTLFDHTEADCVQPEPQAADGRADPAGPAEHEQRPHRPRRRAADRAG
jgi:hypothetical protein